MSSGYPQMNNNMNQKDYYQILGIKKIASLEQIRQAYRKLAFQYHPDRNKGNPAATEKMKEINEAYATLSDSAKRREYDALREQYGSFAYERFRQAHTPEDIFRDSDIDQVFEEFARMFGFRDFDEIFRESYGSGFQTFEFRRPGVQGRGFIFRGSSETEYGTQDQSVYSGQEQFPRVPFPGFIGKIAKYALQKVTGVEFAEKGKDLKDMIMLKPEQAQNGVEVEYSYRKNGKARNLMIKVPPGIRSGQRIRLKGMGIPGKAGGEPGDLYLKVRITIPLSQRLKSFLRLMP